jgi:hypothetical protein
MPVILDTSVEDVWLDTQSSPDALHMLLVPFASDPMETIPVGPRVNNPNFLLLWGSCGPAPPLLCPAFRSPGTRGVGYRVSLTTRFAAVGLTFS